MWSVQALNAAVSLHLPDHLAQGPRSAQTLAQTEGAHPPSVFRLLRALQALGLTRARDDATFELTAAGHLLRQDVPGSLRGRALFAGDMLWKQFGDLSHVVKTGGTTRAIETGAAGFARLEADPVRVAAFQQAMAQTSVPAARDAVAVYGFGRFSTVLDLGGGYGAVLAVLLQQYPAMTGAVCDLAYNEAGARAYLTRAGVGDRSRFLAGNFFESVPAGFDAYLMKFILHDWNDEDALRILRNCRKAAAPATRVVLLERVVPELGQIGAGDRLIVAEDLKMMTVGGQERTAQEYRELFARAGWRMTRVQAAQQGFSVIEAIPQERS
jgi:SAM-dependent methyltransferase